MESQQFECQPSGLSANILFRLIIRNLIASVTATFLLVLFVFRGEIVIGWSMFFDSTIQTTFLIIMGIIFLSNFLAALAISLE
ncbi:unnamed protein product [marine sediment metagenome]|uniref:Uncharacterized protein n=1 Tax=marine sediment metagenome TaxID=412755 RepID=X1A1F7_9ZZZZ